MFSSPLSSSEISGCEGALPLLILFGGRSPEHEISVISAQNIVKSLNRHRWTPLLVGISPKGKWFFFEEESVFLSLRSVPESPPKDLAASRVILAPCGGSQEDPLGKDLPQAFDEKNHLLFLCDPTRPPQPVALAFPILHGPQGEDGVIQGYLELCDLPYAGSGVLASAVGMNKEIFREVMISQGIPMVPALSFTKQQARPSYQELIHQLGGVVFFVKPTAMGSSVGITKVTQELELGEALETAFLYGNTVLVEKAVLQARELECAVLGNQTPRASVVGEIRPQAHHGFYSYEAKYLDPDGATLLAPAPLEERQTQWIQNTALKVFQCLGARGLARVDFLMESNSLETSSSFLTSENPQIYLNEINTFPGFTSISMYPRLWQESGIAYPELIDTLLDLALCKY